MGVAQAVTMYFCCVSAGVCLPEDKGSIWQN